ncbi:putative reverse transcriptase domain-containing protein [Tanacetum coccineum]|uniref:Reverse transcriptase domain-containing protein n=1 Tax=Tanacetum coccineum TaxID=301880 RepID=A0ABQ5D3T3_9ASTR
MLRACVIDFGGSWDTHLSLAGSSYNNSYHSSIRCALFEALYGRKCRSLVLWAEVRENRFIGPEMVQETTNKVVLIKERVKAARDRQKSYVDNRRKPLEFEVGDRVLLKVSPWKGVVRFRKKGKLAPRYVGPFEILERLEVFDGCKPACAIEKIRIDKTLRFVEEPEEIMDREVRILIVKFCWNYKRGPEFTWEREDFMKAKYPNLFADRVNEITKSFGEEGGDAVGGEVWSEFENNGDFRFSVRRRDGGGVRWDIITENKALGKLVVKDRENKGVLVMNEFCLNEFRENSHIDDESSKNKEDEKEGSNVVEEYSDKSTCGFG